MAWVRCCGGTKSLGNYLYKDGEVNIRLTGGLSIAGYTLRGAGYTNDSATQFNSNSIYLPSTASTHYNIFGSVNAIDLTNYNTITCKWIDNGVEKTSTIDVSNVSGSYYVSFSNEAWSSNSAFMGFISASKTNVYTTNAKRFYVENSYRPVTIKEIYMT